MFWAAAWPVWAVIDGRLRVVISWWWPWRVRNRLHGKKLGFPMHASWSWGGESRVDICLRGSKMVLGLYSSRASCVFCIGSSVSFFLTHKYFFFVFLFFFTFFFSSFVLTFVCFIFQLLIISWSVFEAFRKASRETQETKCVSLVVKHSAVPKESAQSGRHLFCRLDSGIGYPH